MFASGRPRPILYVLASVCVLKVDYMLETFGSFVGLAK